MRSKQALDPESDAETRLLTAAEIVFAEKGHEKASLRELTSRAGVNLAAVNYHFGSKDGLVTAVFERLSRRVNRARMKELDRYVRERAQAGAPLELRDILTIFARPYLDGDADHGGLLLARLILQHRLAPTDLSQRIIRQHFDPMAKKFIKALLQACPSVDPAEMYWRYMFMISAVVLTVTDNSKESRVTRLSESRVTGSDAGLLRSALVNFLIGGISALS